MQTVDEYKGYEIVETGWTTEVRTGFDASEVRPVYVIPGMKERPSSPFLTTVQEARDFIDEELAGREAMREARTATFEASVKVRGAASLGVTIPASASRALGLEVGDRVRVTVEKMARRGAGRKAPARSCALAA
ncbi:MAG: AbrB/MazE/SpoVT family DNA-binding domain-containing protein [Candidatus Methanomethylophilaceae archaeon]|nr:AbrB/MazE/SpoVT family DNA-binding domain-containing protein [Candidatus Methanomethylophilaceae archaeon]